MEHAPGVRDSSGLYAVVRRERYGERPGFKITELCLASDQEVPWHLHHAVRDTFYVISGGIRIELDAPSQLVELVPTETFSVPAGRPHRVTPVGSEPATFLVIGDAQGAGEYDFVPVRHS